MLSFDRSRRLRQNQALRKPGLHIIKGQMSAPSLAQATRRKTTFSACCGGPVPAGGDDDKDITGRRRKSCAKTVTLEGVAFSADGGRQDFGDGRQTRPVQAHKNGVVMSVFPRLLHERRVQL